MKVGVITLFGDNYGNKLQNLAVQKILESHGADVETIILDVKQGVRKPTAKCQTAKKLLPNYIVKVLKSRFKNKYLYKNERDGVFKSIKFTKNTDWKDLQKNREESFKKFTDKNIKISPNTLSLINKDEEWLESYDYFIAGSDQVWNPTYPETSSLNFMQFAPIEKRIALAPSIGLSKLPNHVKSLYEKWLNEIPNLSVREQAGANIIKELTGREVPVLADPTLCVAKETWEKVEEKPNFDTETPYVLTYFLGNETNKYRRFIEKYAKKSGCKIINVFDLRESEHYAVNPAEFIYLIHNAKTVFTDSFHGSVFSIIFKTPFVIFDRVETGGKGMSSRIETLLKTFSLQDRKFPISLSKIDSVVFSNCDKVIENLTAKTNDFLNNAFANKINRDEKTQKLVLDKKEDCTGCNACAEICPHNAIEMKADCEGFYYPVIDESRCVNCNLCKKVCPVIQNKLSSFSPRAYVGYSADKEIRENSSSGGMFSVLANAVIEKGGWVYGATFDDKFIVCHNGVNDKQGVKKLRTSKYVQSDARNVFSDVKIKLNNNELVFFSGTPCQIEGLLSYLGKYYENLYTQDIVCHGVPSPAVWKAYLETFKGKKKQVSFRDKKYGWHYFSMHIKTSKKNYIRRLDQDVYTKLFLDNVILRPSCYACHFKKEVRNSDFTLADCWNCSSLDLSLKDDDKGLSMIFVNSEKGKTLFDELGNKVVSQQIDYSKAIKLQTAATKSVNKTEQRAVFFESVSVKGYKETIKNWYGGNAIVELKKNLIYLKTKLRNFIKK